MFALSAVSMVQMRLLQLHWPVYDRLCDQIFVPLEAQLHVEPEADSSEPEPELEPEAESIDEAPVEDPEVGAVQVEGNV